MKLKGSNHVFTVLPNFNVPTPDGAIENRKLPKGERIEFDLEGVSQSEVDALELDKANHWAEKARDEAARLCVESTVAMVRRKFKGVRGLEIDGVGEIKTFDQFYAHAPKELVRWVFDALENTFSLYLSEAKNYEPPPDIPCTSLSAANASIAPPAPSASE